MDTPPGKYESWREVAAVCLCLAAPEYDEDDDGDFVYGSAFRGGIADMARILADAGMVEIVRDDGGRNILFKPKLPEDDPDSELDPALRLLSRVVLSYKRAYRDPGLLDEIETFLVARNINVYDHEG